MKVNRKIRKSFFEQKVGQVFMYTFGTVLFIAGVTMCYFGYFAKNYVPTTVVNLLGSKQVSTIAPIHSNFRYRGYLSMQFIGPVLAALGAFIVMMRSASKPLFLNNKKQRLLIYFSLVGYFINRERRYVGRRKLIMKLTNLNNLRKTPLIVRTEELSSTNENRSELMSKIS